MSDYENEVLKELHDRRSVRAFTGAPIPPEARQAILEAAAQAPSAGCQQLYTILDIRNPEQATCCWPSATQTLPPRTR